LPGSGKSTWAASWVAENPRWRIVSTDAIRAQLFGDETIQGPWLQVEYELNRQLEDAQRMIALSATKSFAQHMLDGVICDATHCRRRYRQRMIQQLQNLGFEIIDALWFDTPLGLCLQRNQARLRQVPAAVIETMQRQLIGAPPSPNEGLRALYRLGA
jgi:predicted kinase